MVEATPISGPALMCTPQCVSREMVEPATERKMIEKSVDFKEEEGKIVSKLSVYLHRQGKWAEKER